MLNRESDPVFAAVLVAVEGINNASDLVTSTNAVRNDWDRRDIDFLNENIRRLQGSVDWLQKLILHEYDEGKYSKMQGRNRGY